MLYEPDDNDLAKERDCIKHDRDRQVDELVKVSDAFVFERQAHAATRRALAEARKGIQLLGSSDIASMAVACYCIDLLVNLASLATPPVPASEQTCEWREDDGGYQTGCGQRFMFTCEGPAANGARFCQYCGKRLVEVLFSEPGEGEEG